MVSPNWLFKSVGRVLFTSGTIQIWGAQMVLGSAAAPYMETSSTTPNPVTGQAATPVPNGLSQTYTYDSFGNLKQNGSFNDISTAQNQLFGYAYDAAGNLLSVGLNTMSWDGESKLVSAGGPLIFITLMETASKSRASE
jgi:hypothetical protein